jgi:hypothetical protein
MLLMIQVFWDVVPRYLINIYWCFEDTMILLNTSNYLLVDVA